MFALEIINALNDPNNPAKPKGLNARLKDRHRPTQGEKRCLGRGKLEDCTECRPNRPPTVFEIFVSHSDGHDGMVHVTGFKVDPTGGFTVTLDDFRDALDAADMELYFP